MLRKETSDLPPLPQGYILCKILWPGWGGEMVPGKKMKNEAVRNKIKKKEKRGMEKKKRKRGRVIFC